MIDNQENSSDESESPLLLTVEQFPKSMRKYWRSRYRLFSRFDDGILLTQELWYSVTPEEVSEFFAKLLRATIKDDKGPIVDLFCGGGGNTIQFLRYFDKVIGIDISKIHLQCTLNNTGVYLSDKNFKDRLKLIQCDWSHSLGTGDSMDELGSSNCQSTIKYLKEQRVEAIFCSPPWGGPSYLKQDYYDTDNLEPFDLEQLLLSVKDISSTIIVFLPRTTRISQIEQVTERVFGTDAHVRVFRLYVHKFFKALGCCWGEKFDSLNTLSMFDMEAKY